MRLFSNRSRGVVLGRLLILYVKRQLYSGFTLYVEMSIFCKTDNLLLDFLESFCMVDIPMENRFLI